MRNLLLLILGVLLSGVVFSQKPGSIYAEVYGDMVTLHEDNASRNCGFAPSLENIVVNENVISWYQTDTIYDRLRCDCTFNYQVEIDSLKSGEYTARVFSVFITDTVYMGTTYFYIETSFAPNHSLKLKSLASDCLSSIEDGIDSNLNFFYDYESVLFYHAFDNIRKISLVNMSGITIETVTGNDTYLRIPVKSLMNGIYVAVIETDNGLQSIRKVILAR